MFRVILLLFSVCISTWIRGQDTAWGPKKEGVQIGLAIRAGAYGLQCDLLAKYSGSKQQVMIGTKLTATFYLESFGENYLIAPGATQYISSLPRLSTAGGVRPDFDYGRLLRKNEVVVIGRYVLPSLERNWDESCYALSERKDTLRAEISNLRVGEGNDSLHTSTGRFPITYCAEENFALEQQQGQARFFELLLENTDPKTTALCIELAQDDLQDELLREAAFRYLADLNTAEARDVLYARCITKDPLLADVLDEFFSTKDPRAHALFNRYRQHPDTDVQLAIASAIGQFADVQDLEILEGQTHAEDRWTRHTAVEALKHFDTDAARRIIYASMRDVDLGVRTMAVRDLFDVGNAGSLPHLADFIERENKDNVGYITTAWEVVAQLSGTDFERDLARLREHIGTR